MPEYQQTTLSAQQKGQVRSVLHNSTVKAAGSTWRTSKWLLESLPESGRRTVNQLESRTISHHLDKLLEACSSSLSTTSGANPRPEGVASLIQASTSAHVAVLGPLAGAVEFVATHREDHPSGSSTRREVQLQALRQSSYTLKNNALFMDKNYLKLQKFVSGDHARKVKLPLVSTLVHALELYQEPFQYWASKHNLQFRKTKAQGNWNCFTLDAALTPSQPEIIESLAGSPAATSAVDDGAEPWSLQDEQDLGLNPSANAEEGGVTLAGAQLDIDTAVSSTPFSQAETEGDSLHDWPMDG